MLETSIEILNILTLIYSYIRLTKVVTEIKQNLINGLEILSSHNLITNSIGIVI